MCLFLKKLIIDKSLFESTLPSPQKLLEFAHNHFLILPDVLYFECATALQREEQLLELFRNVILNGAYRCESWWSIIKKEARELLPYGPLVDLSEVEAVRNTFRNNHTPYNPEDAKELLSRHREVAKELMCSIDDFDKKISFNSPEVHKEIRKWDGSRKRKPERLCGWAFWVDSEDIHKLAVAWLSDLTNNIGQYCLSKDWFTWQYLRLFMILRFEMNFLKHKWGPLGMDSIEHDLQDIQYVALLARAEGLLTKDRGCASLAKAAFPEKDVFSSIDEVTEDYRC
ncbi:MAG: hypothetical protein JW749_07920 [Sedimentisphaerales bacterium]|nr:hypothetical protein [Sedimentisphaerales bacterium]